jgi:hypothetical protein
MVRTPDRAAEHTIADVGDTASDKDVMARRMAGRGPNFELTVSDTNQLSLTEVLVVGRRRVDPNSEKLSLMGGLSIEDLVVGVKMHRCAGDFVCPGNPFDVIEVSVREYDRDDVEGRPSDVVEHSFHRRTRVHQDRFGGPAATHDVAVLAKPATSEAMDFRPGVNGHRYRIDRRSTPPGRSLARLSAGVRRCLGVHQPCSAVILRAVSRPTWVNIESRHSGGSRKPWRSPTDPDRRRKDEGGRRSK